MIGLPTLSNLREARASPETRQKEKREKDQQKRTEEQFAEQGELSLTFLEASPSSLLAVRKAGQRFARAIRAAKVVSL